MARIDIPVSVNVQKALDLPPCAKLRIPKAKPLTLTLPTGSSLQSITDLSKGIPTDCGMQMNIMLQVAPLLAAIDCPLKILGVIGPLMEVISSLTSGEGLICRFRGPGRVLIQTRNPASFGLWMRQFIPLQQQ